MKSRINNSIIILATGFVVLLLLSLPLFWCRWLCEFGLCVIMPREWCYARIQPSKLVPPELENDPNVSTHSEAYASNNPEESKILSLGISDYFEARMPEGHLSKIYYLYKNKEDESWSWMYFDERTGQINCHYTYNERTPGKTFLLVRQEQLYAGPEGVSETADKTLGRFIRPITDARASYFESLIIYDEQLHRFFKVNFKEKTVTKGPELGKDNIHYLIQIGRINKCQYMLNLHWTPPYLKNTEEDSRNHKPIVVKDYSWEKRQYLLVLDETGRIDLLDRETLEFVGSGGYLPSPNSLFPSKSFLTPKDLLAYDVFPLVLSSDHKYRGMFAASVCCEGTAMTLAVFDEEGKLIRSDYTKYIKDRVRRTETTPSSKAVFWEVPWAPTLTITKYLLENLHPPILSLVSYAMADSIEAGAGHRALFILPNSFIAMKGRDVSKNMAEKLYAGLLIILPSIILSVLLAWRVSKDATVVGLCENAKLFWVLATIAFGLAGYITYRLTRPTITLVTCANCGKLRRPDMDRCHRCGSRWHVPELTPPAWRVID